MKFTRTISRFLIVCLLISFCFSYTSVFAAESVGISLSYDGQLIPSSTTLTGGIINSSGVPVYRVQVKATISGSSNFGGQNVTFSVPSSAVLVSTTNPIQMTSTGGPYLGTVTAYIDVRGVTSFSCTATMSGSYTGSGTATITNSKEAYYATSFLVTNYWIAYESDYPTESQTATMNIDGTNVSVRPSFKSAVNMEGSGRLGTSSPSSGRYVQPTWSGGQISGYHYVTYPNGTLQTYSGTSPTAGRTIAVDSGYIPLVNYGATKGCVYVSSYGNRRAEDKGGAITGWHIDIFSGGGLGTSRANSYQSLEYLGNNLNLW